MNLAFVLLTLATPARDCMVIHLPARTPAELSEGTLRGMSEAYITEVELGPLGTSSVEDPFTGHACRFAVTLAWDDVDEPKRMISTLFDRDHPYVPIPPAVVVYHPKKAHKAIRTAAIKLNAMVASRLTFVPEVAPRPPETTAVELAPPPAEGGLGWNRKTVAWFSGGVAVLAAAGTTVFWLQTDETYDQHQTLCPGGECNLLTYSDGRELQQQGERQQAWRTGFLVSALVTGAISASLFTFDGLDALFSTADVHPPPTPTPAGRCAASIDCPGDRVCSGGRCMMRPAKKESDGTFVVAGIVAGTDRRPVLDASVLISGFESSPLQVDLETGEFFSWPIPFDRDAVTLVISAPGYQTVERVVQPGVAGERVTVRVELLREGARETGTLAGSLKDAETGNSLRGKIFIPALDLKVRSSSNGEFSIDVPPGRYQILISSPERHTQVTEIKIRATERVLLNIALEREH